MRSDVNLLKVAEEYLISNRGAFIYLLLDHGGMPGLSSQLSMSAIERKNLFEATAIRVPMSVAPVLVPVGDCSTIHSHASLFKWVVKNGNFSSAVVMFSSCESVDVVMKRLMFRLDIALSDNTSALLRFYDPRILESLVKILTVEQAKNFFSLASQWWYIDRCGGLQQIGSNFFACQEAEMPLRLSAAQEFSLVDSTEPDRVLLALRQNAPHLIANISLAEQYNFAVNSIRSAMGYGLESTTDYVLYSVLSLIYGTEFAVRHEWQSVLAKVRSEPGTFAELVANTDDVAIWDI